MKSWTTGELTRLRAHGHLGLAAVAALLGRSEASTRRAAERHRISLRQPGSRRGPILGQRRGLTIPAAIRADVLSGRVSGEDLARRLELPADADLCPRCGRRPVIASRSGWCDVCHLEALTDAHLAELEKLDAQRALDASRQMLCRARQRAAARAGSASRGLIHDGPLDAEPC